MFIDILQNAKAWAKHLKRDVMALWLAARDRRVSWHAKLVAGVVAAYALSPIDLIPDFIPILGYLDDLVIVPVGILLAIRLVPNHLMEEFQDRGRWTGTPIKPGRPRCDPGHRGRVHYVAGAVACPTHAAAMKQE